MTVTFNAQLFGKSEEIFTEKQLKTMKVFFNEFIETFDPYGTLVKYQMYVDGEEFHG